MWARYRRRWSLVVEYFCWSAREGCLRGAIWSASPFALIQALEVFIQRLSLGDIAAGRMVIIKVGIGVVRGGCASVPQA